MSPLPTSTELLLVPAAYLFGSLSGALLLSRLYGLPDPRRQGSGNPGASNMLRVGHSRLAALTLLIDLLKGALPVALGRLLEAPPAVLSLVGAAAVAGHNWPLWFQFRGGKGVATTVGVCAALSPLLGALQIALWIFMVRRYRIASVAALALVILSPPLCYWIMPEQLLLVTVLSILMVWRHRGNFRALREGRELRF